MKTEVHAYIGECLLVASLACLCGCASSPPPEPSSATPASATDTPPAAGDPSAAGPCVLVCEQPIVDRSTEEPDHDWEEASRNASEVLEAMHDDLMACYTERLVTRPDAHAFMTLSVLVGSDGKVQSVDTEGGALLGEDARACITNRVKQGTFAAPKRGGTLRIEVPFSLRRADEGDS